jgi:hypothetical protein
MAADSALAQEFEADNGWCMYCSRQFSTPGRWWNHLQRLHPDTYRANGVREALERKPTR